MTTAFAFPPVRTTSVALATDGDRPLARFIGQSELADLLASVRGASIVTIEAQTEPRLLARHPVTGESNPFKGNIRKISRVNGMINWVYANSVNNQRCREDLTPDFVPEPRAWGRRLPGSLVEHNGNLYLELKVQRSLDHRYETFDGRALDAAEVEEYLPQRRASRQGVEREVILRDYKLESLRSVRMAGTTFFIRAAAEDAESSAAAARLSA